VQQLSLAEPQLVRPAPLVWQLGGGVAHAPLAQNAVLPVHATALPHCPHALHVCTPLPEHCVAPGVHAGPDPHEHAPHAHVPLHDCVPYVLHDCVAVAAQAPWPGQLPLVTHAPLALHVCVSVPVPQLPHATGFVWVGAHPPVHVAVPLDTTHVWFVHGAGVPHTPVALHVEIPLLVHCVVPGVHATHTPPKHTGLAVVLAHVAPTFCQVGPAPVHCCGCAPLHPMAFIVHVPHTPPEHAGVLPEHAEPLFCHCPSVPHVCGCTPLQPGCPLTHTPWHDAEAVPDAPESTAASTRTVPPSRTSTEPTHVWLTHAAGTPHSPPVAQVTTPLPEQAVCPGPQVPWHDPLVHV
jgi:hypothetical protein